jgi:thiol-disulfide isomerase/thioredoxin
MKIKLFSTITALSIFALVSCGKKDNGGGTTTPAKPAALKVTVDRSTITANGFDVAKVFVTDTTTNTDVTSQCNILVNGISLVGNSFSSETVSTYTFRATKGTSTSYNFATVNTTAPTVVHTQKTIVEDYTGAWCQYCPRIAKALDDAYAANNSLIPIAVHNGDAFVYQFEAQMRAKWGVTGFPTAIMNRDVAWSENNALLTAVNPYLSRWAPLGIALESATSGTTVTGKAKIKFNVTSSTLPVNITIMLLENGKVLAQANAYNNTAGSPFQGLGNPIPNYVHNHILRQASTSVFGDVVPQTAVVKDAEYEKSFTFNTSGYDLTKCDIVAVASYADGYTKKGAINAQMVKVGQNKNYD